MHQLGRALELRFEQLPLLNVAKSVVGPRLTSAGLLFVPGGFDLPDDSPAFNAAGLSTIHRSPSSR